MYFATFEYMVMLGLVVAVFPFLPKRGRTVGMLLASYIFYLGQAPIHLAVLVCSTLLDFIVGIQLGRVKAKASRRWWLGFSLCGNLGALAAFKYAGLFTHAWNWLPSTPVLDVPAWVLPLGISFYTFQTIGYTIDVYQRRIDPCRNLIDFALFVSFFPQLIAGPIERTRGLLPQLQNLSPINLANLSLGLRLILWGSAKKLCVADRLRAFVMDAVVDPSQADSLSLILISFSLLTLIYLDFSAYTDIARGSARLFGVNLAHNFQAPFTATSVSDFTRRWHMSLIQWIEQYLFVPLMSGGITIFKIWRANVLLIALFGLWHGPYLSYVFGGVTLGIAISIEQTHRLVLAKKGRRVPKSRTRAVLGWAASLCIWSSFSVVIFTQEQGTASSFIKGLLAGGTPDWLFIAKLGAILAALFVVHAAAARADLPKLWARIPGPLRVATMLLFAIAVIRGGATESPEFIYFRF